MKNKTYADRALELANQKEIIRLRHYQIQANTVRNTSVLSIMFIGLHILRHLDSYKTSKKQLIQAFSYISNYVLDWENYDCAKLRRDRSGPDPRGLKAILGIKNSF